MAIDTLINIVRFSAVDPGDTATIDHGLEINGVGRTPDLVMVSNGNFAVTATSTTQITVRNDGAIAGDCDVWCEYKHSFLRNFPTPVPALTPAPFIAAGGVSGAIGGGANLIVWTVAKTWAEVYAEIQAADGPKIVLVERDDAGARTMTNNGGSPTDLWDVLFVALSQQAYNFSGPRQVDINVDDEFLLGVEPNSEYAILMSQNINWQFDCTTAPIVTDELVYIQLDGGELSHNNNVCFVTSNFRANLYNGANMSGTGGASLVQESAAPLGGTHVIRAVNTAQLGSLIMDSQDGTGLTVYTDPTVEINPTAFDALTTVTYNGSSLLLISPDGTQWLGTVDNLGALTFS